MPPSKSLQHVSILVVDDSVDTLKFLEKVFERQGALVTLAASVQEALAHLTKFKPDVIVSDIAMPDMTGYDLIRAVRGQERETGATTRDKTPAVAVTGHCDRDQEAVSRAAGFQVHIGKPVNPRFLVEIVRRLAELDGEAVERGFAFERDGGAPLGS